MLYLEVFFYNILPLQLFDIVARYDTLRNVINSVTRNLKSILLTAILALILIFLYSIFGYIFFPGDFLMPTHPVEDMEASCPSECILVTHECIYPFMHYIAIQLLALTKILCIHLEGDLAGHRWALLVFLLLHVVYVCVWQQF